MKVADLFAGGGGAALFHLAKGWEEVAHVEMAEAPVRVLRQRMADGHLPSAPVYQMKVGEFVAQHAHKGMADLICAGFPCQPFSASGKRKGGDDGRNGWPETVTAIQVIQPRFLWLENVAGLISHPYFWVILGDLVGLGYDINWGIFSAADAGAPHQRKRVWLFGSRERLQPPDQEPSAIWQKGWRRAQQMFRFADEEVGKAPANGRLRGNRVYTAEWPKTPYGEGQGRPWQTVKLHDAKPLSIAEYKRNSPPLMAEVAAWAMCPTVTVEGNSNRAGLSEKSGDGLSTAAKHWAAVGALHHGPRKNPKIKKVGANDTQVNLIDQVKYWATVTASDYRRRGPNSVQQGLPEEVKGWDLKKLGQLNPEWVELLMGWPVGWTSGEPLDKAVWEGWPMGQGVEQWEYEPSRLVQGMKGRPDRIKMLGNGQVPQTAALAWNVLSEGL
jgi:DNA-cytosine methyltransferase